MEILAEDQWHRRFRWGNTSLTTERVRNDPPKEMRNHYECTGII